METIIKKVYTFITDNNLIVCGDRVLVAASAGKDSMALLHILFALKSKLNFTITVYHLDHMVRGQESFDDLLFVLAQASRYGIPAILERYDFNNRRQKGKSFEQQAREYRYERLKSIANDYGYTKIATAHTKNDQVETLLMRIFQGTGLQGLQGITVHRENIVRPLLVLTQQEVYDYLQCNQLLYRHDSTNDDEYYLRNYIRHTIIPVIKERFPHFDNALVNLGKQAHDAIQSINHLMMQLHPECTQVFPHYIQVEEKAISSSEYLFKFFCAYIISNYLKKYVDTNILDAVYHAHFSKKKNCTLFEGKGVYIYRRYRHANSFLLFCAEPLIVGDSNYEYILPIGQTVTIKEAGITIACEITESVNMQQSESQSLILRYTGCDHIVIRNRRTGDAFISKAGRRSLKRLYIDYKLTPEQKKKVPLIVIDNKIAAVLRNVVMQQKPAISLLFLPEKAQKMLVIRYWFHNNV
ncbi:MAG: tRNA lysidine(34) synthetase TilS [Spirochaetes bacterium]|nr:tRNA lysidine(34) synthetase TilS [Spirochaetota bacterium]